VILEIVAGALADAQGRVLIAQRPPGKELAGRWEFPGGKLHANESPRAGLARELREELGVEVLAAESLIRYPHEYPDKTVWLDLWLVTSWRGDPRGLDGQALRWVEIAKLPDADLLEADRPIVEALVAMSVMPRA
jgi:8-oxo-dGTP diphosphatase